MSGTFHLRDDRNLHAIFVQLFTDLARPAESGEDTCGTEALILALGFWLKEYGALSERELQAVARGEALRIRADAYWVRGWLAVVAGELLRRRGADALKGGVA